MKKTAFDMLPELEQFALRRHFHGRFVEIESEYNKLSADELENIVTEYITSSGHFTKDSPFMQIREMERMAIRYYLRSQAFSGDYDAKCNEIALDKKLLKQLEAEYKHYAGIE